VHQWRIAQRAIDAYKRDGLDAHGDREPAAVSRVGLTVVTWGRAS
jgi:hypothetical protein